MGFVSNNEVKTTYNHYDSYPAWLGRQSIEFVKTAIQGGTLTDFEFQAQSLRPVDEDHKPTPEQLARFKAFSEEVSEGDDWYSALRKCQGNWALTLQSGYIILDQGFALDSLFCEYGYLVNFDDKTVEYYVGFQKSPHDKGRYATQANPEPQGHRSTEYYPIALLKAFTFDEIRDRSVDEIVAEMEALESAQQAVDA
jgi:hypothetical protein